MTFVPVTDNLRVHVTEDDYLLPWERSVPVVMVHGFSRNAEIWRRWVPVISRDRRIHRIDLRGCGKSDVPGHDYVVSLDLIFGDILKVLDRLEIKKAHLVGESSSGQFLFAFSCAFPERVASLTTCDTTPQMRKSVFDVYKLDSESPAEAIRKYGTGEWCRQTLSNRTDATHSCPEMDKWLLDMLRATPTHVAAAMIECFFGIDNHPRLTQLDVPLLLLTGSETGATSLEEQRMIHDTVTESRLCVFNGHRGMVHVYRAGDCAKAARRFWKDVDNGRPVRDHFET